MNGTTWMWIVAVILVIAIAVAVMATVQSRKRLMASHRSEAAELRDDSAEHNLALRESEASAMAVEAHARGAHAEADLRAAEALQLEVKAQRENDRLYVAQQTHEEQLRKADSLDPDVETDREGYRLDDDGSPQTADSNGGATNSARVSGDRQDRTSSQTTGVRVNGNGQADDVDAPAEDSTTITR